MRTEKAKELLLKLNTLALVAGNWPDIFCGTKEEWQLSAPKKSIINNYDSKDNQ